MSSNKIISSMLRKSEWYEGPIFIHFRCNTCADYIYKGRKFNAKCEVAEGENFLGLRIYRFYIRCPKCITEIMFKVMWHEVCDLRHGISTLLSVPVSKLTVSKRHVMIILKQQRPRFFLTLFDEDSLNQSSNKLWRDNVKEDKIHVTSLRYHYPQNVWCHNIPIECHLLLAHFFSGFDISIFAMSGIFIHKKRNGT